MHEEMEAFIPEQQSEKIEPVARRATLKDQIDQNPERSGEQKSKDFADAKFKALDDFFGNDYETEEERLEAYSQAILEATDRFFSS